MSGWGWLRRALFADLDPSDAYLHGRLAAFGGTIRSAAGIPTGLQERLAYWLQGRERYASLYSRPPAGVFARPACNDRSFAPTRNARLMGAR
jgi:hypothetical protein